MAKLTEANERLQAQAAYVEELAMAKERNRLAREIHDSLGHALTTMAVQLEAAGALHTTEPARALGAVNQARTLAQEALADVRRSVGTLRVETDTRVLSDRLQALLVSDEKLAVRFALLGEPRVLSAEKEHALFRAAQEGLTNVRRHAQARTAVLTLDYGNERVVVMSVTDDGHGLRSAMATSGFGLKGLRERAAALGGRVVAADAAEGGFLLRMEVPA